MKKYLQKSWALIFIFLVWFIFASPYFVHGKVPFPSTYQVNFFHPWSSMEKFWGPVKNNAMPDIIGEIYPWRHFSIEMWKKGQVAFWNPYSFSGNPHLANYQSAVFSPFNLIFFIIQFVDAWSILVLIQPLLAGIFMYLLTRELKIGKIGSLISSISFMFCGFIVVWMAYGTLSMAIAFLPLTLFAIKRSFNNFGLLPLVILAVSLPFSFFSGHFQTSLYLFILAFSFLIFEAFKNRKPRIIFFVSLSFFLGFLISMIQIIPSMQFYSNSVRSGIFIKGGGIPFFYLVNIFSPDFFGNPVTRNDWFGYYAEWASFIGVIPLTLSLFAISKKNIPSLFFLFIGIIALILAIDSPLTNLISSLRIPVLSTSAPNRIIILFSFSFAVLSGFGFESLKELISKKNFRIVIIPFLIVGLIIIAAWASVLVFKMMPYDKLIIAKRNLLLPATLFAGMLILVFSSLKYKKLILVTIFYLLFAMSYDSLRFAVKWMPFDPKELVFPQVSVIEGIKKNIGNGRIFGNFGASIDTYYGFPGIEGYDPLYIQRYGEFIRSAADGSFVEAERSVVTLPRNGKYTDRVLDLLGVSLVFHPIADTNQGWAYPVWKDKNKFSVVYKDDRFQLFKNNTAMSRATLFYNYQVIDDSKKVLKRFYSDDFNFRNTLLLEEDPNRHAEFSSASKILNQSMKQVRDMVQNDNKQTEIISYTPNKIVIEINTTKAALLFLSDNYYPGWKAYINDHETKIYRADYTFRAVVVPKGKSNVEFVYKGIF